MNADPHTIAARLVTILHEIEFSHTKPYGNKVARSHTILMKAVEKLRKTPFIASNAVPSRDTYLYFIGGDWGSEKSLPWKLEQVNKVLTDHMTHYGIISGSLRTLVFIILPDEVYEDLSRTTYHTTIYGKILVTHLQYLSANNFGTRNGLPVQFQKRGW